MPYPVVPTTMATDHLEVSVLVILGPLLSRQPVPQKPLTSLLGLVRVTEFTKPVPDGSYQAQAVHDPPTRECQPPTKRGKNSVSSAVGSKLRTIEGSPEALRTAAV